jgi:hypothetical protein
MKRIILEDLLMTHDDFKRQIEKGLSVAELLVYLEGISRQELSCATTGDGKAMLSHGDASSGETVMTNNGRSGTPHA